MKILGMRCTFKRNIVGLGLILLEILGMPKFGMVSKFPIVFSADTNRVLHSHIEARSQDPAKIL